MRSIELAALFFGASLPCFAEDKLPGFDTPEKAFHAYVTGAVSQDFELTLSSLTPEAKAYHIGLALFSAEFLFGKDPEMQKVFREHGIEPSSGDGKAKKEMDATAREKAFVTAMLKIKNPAKLMRQIAERHQKLARLIAQSLDTPPKSKLLSEKELLAAVTLGKVAITRDSAAATVTVAAPAKELLRMPEMVQFRRIKNRWYCHIDPR
jgi:hypothetical protein